MSDARPEGYFQFAPSAFPIQIEILRSDTRELVWKQVMEKPTGDTAGQMTIPPVRQMYGVEAIVRVKFADSPDWMETHA